MPETRRGFTLVEVMVASACGVIVLAAALYALLNQSRTHQRQQQISEMQQALRPAAEMIMRDVRMAGYGVPVSRADLPTWITWVSGVTNPIILTQGATTSSPDQITLVGAFEPPAATLQSAEAAGSTSLHADPTQASRFNTTDRSVIFIGRTEIARVISITGNIIAISTHPTQIAVGLCYAYPAGTPIELVKVVTYSCGQAPTNLSSRPCLLRDDYVSGFTNTIDRVLALGIDDLQVAVRTNAIELTLEARAANPDPAYTHPTKGDHYRRASIRSIISPRNGF